MWLPSVIPVVTCARMEKDEQGRPADAEAVKKAGALTAVDGPCPSARLLRWASFFVCVCVRRLAGRGAMWFMESSWHVDCQHHNFNFNWSHVYLQPPRQEPSASERRLCSTLSSKTTSQRFTQALDADMREIARRARSQVPLTGRVCAFRPRPEHRE